ncbi:hypothetical protein [Mycobacteroides abscessus]|nr:hypothetical protein [Mycobacteroides abscessus]SKV22863.1 Uncharacterised protein [Mycobacteroides abscessus subsp. abscessus]
MANYNENEQKALLTAGLATGIALGVLTTLGALFKAAIDEAAKNEGTD